MGEVSGTPSAPAESTAPQRRIFLVVVDDTEEWRAALRFACLRAAHTGGRVALLHVIEPGEMQHFLAVRDVMREELRAEAEQRLQRVAKDVIAATGTLPVLYLREGGRRDELLKLLDEDPSISILVLGASTSSEGPGPLIQYLTTRGIGRLRIPLTIVPGGLTEAELDHLG
jgi:nucleotide-binding universal stress UspA family protein